MPTPGIVDIHTRLASHYWGIPEDNLTREQRRTAKISAFETVQKPPSEIAYVEAFMHGATDEARRLLTQTTSLGITATEEIAGLLESLRWYRDHHDEDGHIIDVRKAFTWISYVSPDMPLGLYDHFKGGLYLATGTAHWASGNMEDTVEYTSLTGKYAGRKSNRFASQWCEIVLWPDGKLRSRYVYRGIAETPPPPWKVTPDPSLL